jgi:hypothetical protein
MFGFGIKNVQFFEFFEKLNFLDTEIERGCGGWGARA